MKQFIGLAAILLALVCALGVESSAKNDSESRQAELAEGINREGKIAKIVGFYSQTTLLSIITATTSSIFTCLSITNAINCSGKRKRRSFIKAFDENIENEAVHLDGSSKDDSFVVQQIEKIDERTGRRITVWSSVYSTLQLFTTMPILGSTVTVSALCSAIGGSAISPGCFLG